MTLSYTFLEGCHFKFFLRGGVGGKVLGDFFKIFFGGLI